MTPGKTVLRSITSCPGRTRWSSFIIDRSNSPTDGSRYSSTGVPIVTRMAAASSSTLWSVVALSMPDWIVCWSSALASSSWKGIWPRLTMGDALGAGIDQIDLIALARKCQTERQSDMTAAADDRQGTVIQNSLDLFLREVHRLDAWSGRRLHEAAPGGNRNSLFVACTRQTVNGTDGIAEPPRTEFSGGWPLQPVRRRVENLHRPDGTVLPRRWGHVDLSPDSGWPERDVPMRNGLFQLYSLILLLLLPVYALAQEKATRSTQATTGAAGSVIRELASAWWLWAGIIVILGLIGLLFYLTKPMIDRLSSGN